MAPDPHGLRHTSMSRAAKGQRYMGKSSLSPRAEIYQHYIFIASACMARLLLKGEVDFQPSVPVELCRVAVPNIVLAGSLIH